jgi:hypothetical protein
MGNKRANLLIGIVFAILLVSGMQARAQTVELSPLIGYETGASVAGGIQGVQGDFTAALVIKLR